MGCPMGSREEGQGPAKGRDTARPARLAAFALTAAIATYYALRGGSYDIVVRQEEGIVIWLVLGLGAALGLLPRARLPRLALDTARSRGSAGPLDRAQPRLDRQR